MEVLELCTTPGKKVKAVVGEVALEKVLESVFGIAHFFWDLDVKTPVTWFNSLHAFTEELKAFQIAVHRRLNHLSSIERADSNRLAFGGP